MGGNPSKFRFVRAAILWVVAHFILTILCMGISMGSSMEQFDNPEYSPSPLVDPISILAEILMRPGSSVWTSWMSRNMPDIVEWLVFLGNSFLWGVVIATGIQIWTGIRKERKPSGM